MDGCVYIILVNYNGMSYLEEFMQSLERQTYKNYKVVFVDSCSPDDSGIWFEENYPQHKVFLENKNIGYAKGCNIGIHYARQEGADYVLLLNIDTVLEDNLIEELVKYSKGRAVTTPKIYSSRDKVNIWYAGGSIDYEKGTNVHFHDERLECHSVSPVHRVSFVSGCCMLIPNFVLQKVGSLDEKFYMYYDDVDMCVRLRKIRIPMYYISSTSLWHKVGGSYDGIRSVLTEYYCTRNKLYFIKKHKDVMQISCHEAAWDMLQKKVIKAGINDKKYAPHVFRGIFDFYFNRLYMSSHRF